MTSTSCCHQLFRNPHETDRPAAEQSTAARECIAPSTEHTAQARRMRAFAGQRKFQAPVADDFSRGMLADRQPLGEGSAALKHHGLINSLAAWWRSQKFG